MAGFNCQWINAADSSRRVKSWESGPKIRDDYKRTQEKKQVTAQG